MDRFQRWLSRLGLAGLIGASLVLTGTTRLSAHTAVKRLPVLRLDNSSDPGLQAIIDPIVNNRALSDYNGSLVDILPSGRTAAGLAHWTISNNGRVYTFTIRKTARFANGHYVTASDAAFSLRRDLTPSIRFMTSAATWFGLIEGAQAYQSGKAKGISGVKVLGRRILRITITQSAGYFPEMISYLYVLDPAVVAGKPLGTATSGFKGNYLTNTCIGQQGAGPFRFVCHDRSSTVHSYYSGRLPMYTLVPNRYYYGPKPHIELQFPVYASGYKAYIEGKVDGTSIPAIQVNHWRGRPDLRLFPSSFVQFLEPDVQTAPFNDLHCRLAVAYALDRSAVATVGHGGFDIVAARPTYAIVPKGMLGYYAGNNNPHYNPRLARTEFAQCPSRAALVNLKFLNTGPSAVNMYTLIASELRAIGMDVKLTALSYSDWGAVASLRLTKSDTQLFDASWIQDYPDPQDYLFYLLHSGSVFSPGGWSNTAYDRLVDRADALSNRKQRAKLYIRAQHVALSHGAVISLLNGINGLLTKPYVHGMVQSEALDGGYPKNLNWANVSIGKH